MLERQSTQRLFQRLVDFDIAFQHFGHKLRKFDTALPARLEKYSHTLFSIETGMRTLALGGM